MKINRTLLIFLLVGIAVPLFAQGPPPPPAPAPSGVPFDGGIILFLIASILGGLGLLTRNKK